MVPINREPERPTSSNHSSSIREAEVPIAIDECLVADDMDEDYDEDLSEDSNPSRARPAQTLYHQARSESDTINSTQSLFENDIEYLTIDERRYCENYNMPNDDAEQGRLQMLHEIFLNTLDGHLTLAPLQSPTMILDIGTGTGEWAIEMAELYPGAEVTGTDIAKIQPTSVPDNMFFQIDDAEYEGGWTWQANTFDLVHIRAMTGAFEDWNNIYREAFRTIKPGGYIEIMDPDVPKFAQHFSDNPLVLKWFNNFLEAARMTGRPMTVEHLDTQLLAAAGFTDIVVTTRTLPCGACQSESGESKTGTYFLHVLFAGTEATSLRLFVEQLGWKLEDVRALCSYVSKSFKAMAFDPEKSKGFGMDVRIIVARKPGGNELEVPDDKSTMGDSMRTVRNGDSST
ncbi:hypothetical protein VTL71DRAFT_15970 [Oculimacula yallundae]|uniref:Methyltransferase n=1 Tax=Oculimacula yallundae TaxID=86028 RepID=A0ABR4CDV9_9HELO